MGKFHCTLKQSIRNIINPLTQQLFTQGQPAPSSLPSTLHHVYEENFKHCIVSYVTASIGIYVDMTRNEEMSISQYNN
jgi:hypothetical protein